MNRLDLIDTDEARVARKVLAPNEISPQHFHSNLIENIVCLNGSIEVHEHMLGEIVTRLMKQRTSMTLIYLAEEDTIYYS